MLKPASHIEEAYNLNILPPKDILLVQSGTIHNPPSPQKKIKEKKIEEIKELLIHNYKLKAHAV